jgi:type VI secretion system protein VasD
MNSHLKLTNPHFAEPTPAGRYKRQYLLGLACACLAFTFSGCSSTPKPVVSALNVSIEASADVNPDARRRASPVTVRLYAMKSAAPFESADFFSLFEKDIATLGAELVQREEMLLKPGEQKPLAFKFGPDVKAIAVMAAFRDLERSRWRAVHTVDVGQSTDLAIKFSGTQISIDAVPTPQKPRFLGLPKLF